MVLFELSIIQKGFSLNGGLVVRAVSKRNSWGRNYNNREKTTLRRTHLRWEAAGYLPK